MKHRILTLLFVISLILLALSPERAGLAQENPPAYDLTEGERAVITPVIGYQGRLVEGGTPVNESRNMTFRLYNASSGGTLIWSEIDKPVSVENGLFQTALGSSTAFTQAVLDQMTQELWLEVQVGSTILGRQKLMGAPYAFSLAPGANVEGSYNEGNILQVKNTGFGTGFAGISNLTGTGVYGESGGGGYGVKGFSESGIGVYAESKYDYGIKAKSASVYSIYADGYGSGLLGAALFADANAADGIAIRSYANSSDASMVVENFGDGPIIKAFGKDAGSDAEFIVETDGSVSQDLVADGLVKAGVFFYCGSSSSSIYRSFNNINSSTISISNGTESGRCTLNLGFDLSNRYWVVMNGQNSFNNYSSKCFLDVGNGSIMYCHSWSSSGTNINTQIMLLVY